MVSGHEGRVFGFKPYSEAVKTYANLMPARLEHYPVVEKDGVIYLRADVATGPPGRSAAGAASHPPWVCRPEPRAEVQGIRRGRSTA